MIGKILLKKLEIEFKRKYKHRIVLCELKRYFWNIN